jgi:mRNA-degrading endonuclease RelE of RelBE toxin-antitoxin system
LSKKFISLPSDINQLGASLSDSPFQGDHLGDGYYKVRMAITSKARGKSGGSRVITCVRVHNSRVYLLAIYDKGEFVSFSPAELRKLKTEAALEMES